MYDPLGYPEAMSAFRRSLRVWVTAWLVFQVASLSALVPRDCCPSHRPAADTAERKCDQSVAATQCPMRAPDGTPCPMHRGQSGHDHGRATGGDHRGETNECSLRGTCAGPMAAVMALLQNHGILPAAVTILPDADGRTLAALARENLVSRFEPPDSPPPRA